MAVPCVTPGEKPEAALADCLQMTCQHGNAGRFNQARGCRAFGTAAPVVMFRMRG
jgi:hypothetical protein